MLIGFFLMLIPVVVVFLGFIVEPGETPQDDFVAAIVICFGVPSFMLAIICGISMLISAL